MILRRSYSLELNEISRRGIISDFMNVLSALPDIERRKITVPRYIVDRSSIDHSLRSLDRRTTFRRDGAANLSDAAR